MPADICIHQGEDGTVCGERDFHPIHDGYNGLRGMPGARMLDGRHVPIPGRKCPTCDGSGYYWALWGESKGQKLPCPACANSPVRGYVRAE